MAEKPRRCSSHIVSLCVPDHPPDECKDRSETHARKDASSLTKVKVHAGYLTKDTPRLKRVISENRLMVGAWGAAMPWGERIYPHRAELMKPQMYSSARIMLYEALVRACTHRSLTKHGTAEEAAQQLRGEVCRGFFWTPQLSKLLGEYETSRDKYATFEAFMPRIVAFFESVATDMDSHLAKLPRVKRITPASGTEDVDPGATELRIEFDRRMDPKAAGLFGQKSEMPMLIGEGRFGDDGKTFVQPIKLAAGKTYRISINTVWSPGFASADGLPLDPVQLTFTTRKK